MKAWCLLWGGVRGGGWVCQTSMDGFRACQCSRVPARKTCRSSPLFLNWTSRISIVNPPTLTCSSMLRSATYKFCKHFLGAANHHYHHLLHLLHHRQQLRDHCLQIVSLCSNLARPINRSARRPRTTTTGSEKTSPLLCVLAIPLVVTLGANCRIEDEEEVDGDVNQTKKTSTSLRIWPFPASSTPQATTATTSKTATEAMLPAAPAPPAAQIPPGRPETLTAEEEAKLKEYWQAVLKCFGAVGGADPTSPPVAPAPSTAAPSGADAPATTAATETNGSGGKRSSLGRLLSKREKTPAPPLVEDANDKYGASKDFQTVLASQTPAELRDAFWEMVKCDNPDGLLLRFLRARKWDVEKALVMMVATMHWRIKVMDVRWARPLPPLFFLRAPEFSLPFLLLLFSLSLSFLFRLRLS